VTHAPEDGLELVRFIVTLVVSECPQIVPGAADWQSVERLKINQVRGPCAIDLGAIIQSMTPHTHTILGAIAPPRVPTSAASRTAGWMTVRPHDGARGAPSPPPRTNWTRRVPHTVLTGHAASLTPY